MTDEVSKTSRSYWAGLSTQKLIDGYLKPHVGKAREEGAYVRQFMLEEAMRRLQATLPVAAPDLAPVEETPPDETLVEETAPEEPGAAPEETSNE